MVKKITFLLCLLFPFITLDANNIAVTNIKFTGQNTASQYSLIQFDISWENSFRVGTGPSNWDAAWVFAKYRISVANGGDGVWKHANLSNTGYTAPSGSTITPGLLLPGSAYNISTNPVVGVFLYRDAIGTGTFSKAGVQLQWNYGANGVSDNALVDIQVFAIEMVYVPQGAYYLGTGGTERGSFTAGPYVQGNPTIPFQVTSENAITFANSAGNLWCRVDPLTDYGDQLGPIPADFPKGYAAFYCMKYEISQQGYVDFLNTLTYTQQASRTSISPTSFTGTYLYNTYRNRVKIAASGANSSLPACYSTDYPNVSCNFLNWSDLAAYLDWSCIRPMTELEYEKACRGTLSPVPYEYAWGTTGVAALTYSVGNSGLNNESIASNFSTTSGNATYGVTDPLSGVINGPVRVGIFSANGANSGRVTAGATYYGIMEMNGNNWERPVTEGNPTGRAFTATNGNGALDASGFANVASWPGTSEIGTGFKGCDWDCPSLLMQVSDRYNAGYVELGRYPGTGGRGVRSAP
jgi:hypothetical protein